MPHKFYMFFWMFPNIFLDCSKDFKFWLNYLCHFYSVRTRYRTRTDNSFKSTDFKSVVFTNSTKRVLNTNSTTDSGNRTHIFCLENKQFTINSYPLTLLKSIFFKKKKYSSKLRNGMINRKKNKCKCVQNNPSSIYFFYV